MVPVHDVFAADSEPIVVATGDGLAALARHRLADGLAVVSGLDALWGFACPILGQDMDSIGSAVQTRLGDLEWDRLFLPGYPDDLVLARAIGPWFGRFGTLYAGPGIGRRVADIGALDQWWGRRSPRFRRNLRRAERAATERGLRYVDLSGDLAPSDVAALIERLVAIEDRSWKGAPSDDGEPSGIAAPPMQALYRSMVDRLAGSGRARAVIAVLDGVDVGYILGGIRRGRYRGLQLSFTTDVGALSIGHLLQWHEIRHLAADGLADTYDLGMDMGYKAAWSDRLESSVVLVLERDR